MRGRVGNQLRARDQSRVRRSPTPQAPTAPLLAFQRTAGNRAVTAALEGSRGHAELEADQLGRYVARAVRPTGASSPGSVLGRLERALGWDLAGVRLHVDEADTQGALAYTRGKDVYFSPGSFQPQTQSGLALIGHEVAHVQQQEVGAAPHGGVQKKEDWDFTPADYAALVKEKRDLRFAPDSAWFPKALQENLLTTLKFALTSTRPTRTAGINVKDFYHGHFVIPKGTMKPDLRTKISEFGAKSEELQGKALGGNYFDEITKENLPAYTKAMQETEKLATPLLDEALKIKGAAVIYHTYEMSGPQMQPGSPTRNIRTLIGGTPAGYDPSGKEKSANQYMDEYNIVLQFAFLVDETGVIHVTVGTTSNLSRVTGTPLK